MKIVHICLAGSYNDYWGYQDNIIPKYHRKEGHEVTVITSVFKDRTDKMGYYKVDSGEYLLEDGTKIIRIPFIKTLFPKVTEKLRIYKGLLYELKKENPDFIFIHGGQFLSILTIKSYIKQRKVKPRVVLDNHADFSNSATNVWSKFILHKMIWRFCINSVDLYCTKYYGVLPSRVDFLLDVYKTPKKKTELLVLGADDELVEAAKESGNIKSLRRKFNIKEDDFLLVTGGKIDFAKKQTLSLMKYALNNQKNIKLIVFGSVVNELKSQFDSLVDGHKVQYAGWISNEDSYNYLAAADLAVFPGRHSVFWEQTVGIGTPMVVKFWDGLDHIDVGGNCLFLYEDSYEEVEKKINEIVSDQKLFYKMKQKAESEGKSKFSYKNISETCLHS